MKWVRNILPALSAVTIAAILLFFSIRVVQIDGNSMQPIKNDMDIAVIFIQLGISPPSQGDIILYKNPLDNTLTVKRCLLAPGSYFSIEGKAIVVQNIHYELSDYALNQLSGYNTMPADSYFFVGDNRKVSIDSTLYGIVNRDMLIGKVIF